MSVKLETIENDSNYVATIVKLPELKKVEGLDNLMVANVFGYNCLVGKDSSPDILYVFFPSETVLSQEFLRTNNLYRKSGLNDDKNEKGFFEENGRVKAIKFKGIVSSGYLTPVDAIGRVVGFGDSALLNEGDTFHIIEGIEICKKFRRPVAPDKLSRSAHMTKRLEKFDIVIPNQFRFHESTPQFLRFLSDFKEGDRIVITEKLHGTSAVFSNVLTKRKLNMIERFMDKMRLCSIKKEEYYHLYSSRSVIKNDDIQDERNKGGGYYGEDIWGIYAKLLEGKIEKGITLYGEIVGYTPSGAYIQKGYHYGCQEGESKFYVYRITYTTPDGVVVEFTDNQIRQYCNIREIPVVPLIGETIWRGEQEDDFGMTGIIVGNIEVMCPMNGEKVPREGVVIRRDGKETYSAYKLKSQLFLTHETKAIDDGVEDTEEAN